MFQGSWGPESSLKDGPELVSEPQCLGVESVLEGDSGLVSTMGPDHQEAGQTCRVPAKHIFWDTV